MDQRVLLRNFSSNGSNENVLLAGKSAFETPRKMPFKDTTNKTFDIPKSALKPSNAGSEKIQSMKSQEHINEDEMDFDPFVFPPDMNCFCCGDNRKTDGQVWGEQMAFSEEFMTMILSTPLRRNEVFVEPLSPLKLSIIDMSFTESDYQIAVPEIPDMFCFDQSMDLPSPPLTPSKIQSDVELTLPRFNVDLFKEHDNPTSAVDTVIPDELNSSLEIPDCSFAFDCDDSSSAAVDNSIIQDW